MGVVVLVLCVKTLLFPARATLGTGVPLPAGAITPQIDSNGDRAALLAPDGSIWAWGGTETELAGLAGTSTITETPVRVGSDSDWAQVALGALHTIALKTNGTLWAWGKRDYRQQHDHQLEEADSSVPNQIGADTNWSKVSTGGRHALALKMDGRLYAWGHNSSGQIGNGTTENVLELHEVQPGGHWVTMAAGAGNSFGIKKNGTLWIWGSDPLPVKEDYLVPTQIGSATNWVSVVASAFEFLALKSDGTLWVGGHNASWSYDAFGGKQSRGVSQIGKESDWKDVYAGHGFFFGRKRDGRWWVCGGNTWGQLGIGGSIGILGREELEEPEPLPYQMEPWALATHSGVGNTLMLATDGTLWSWGARLGAPPAKAKYRPWKLRFNRALYTLSGEKIHGFSLQDEKTDTVPRKIWELPAEIKTDLRKNEKPETQ